MTPEELEDHPCRGCYIFENINKYICPLTDVLSKFNTSAIENCPCRICLVKGICSTTCQTFNDYIHKEGERMKDEQKKKL